MLECDPVGEGRIVGEMRSVRRWCQRRGVGRLWWIDMAIEAIEAGVELSAGEPCVPAS